MMREFHEHIDMLYRRCAAGNLKAAVFFHTSVLSAGASSLNSALHTPYQPTLTYYIPENCCYEMKLLAKYSDSRLFSGNAEMLVKQTSARDGSAPKINTAVDMTALYAEQIDLCAKYKCDEAIFVFLSYKAADDFRRRIKNRNGVKILCFDPYIDALLPDYPVRPDELPVIRTEKTGFLHERLCFSCNDCFSIVPADGVKLPSKALFSEFKFLSCGGEGVIYTYDKMPLHLIKLFLFRPKQGTVDKLASLMLYHRTIPSCALPKALIYHNGSCVGFVMDKVPGKDLDLFLRETDAKAAELYNGSSNNRALEKFYEENDKLKTEIIKNITVCFLQLRLISYTLTDLSASNIIVGSNGKITFIDCDSGEFKLFPGGGSKIPFAHPDDTEENHFNKLKPYEYIDFSYTVLLWQFFFGDLHPLNQKLSSDEELEWGKTVFPFANDFFGTGICTRGCRVNETGLDIWTGMGRTVREAFSDTFTFRRIRDAGSWIRLTGLA